MLYDYKNNIKLEKNEKGEIVMTMNDAIFTEMIINTYYAKEYQKEQGLNATARKTRELLTTLYEKEEELEENQ